jgi:hypothetical protein
VREWGRSHDAIRNLWGKEQVTLADEILKERKRCTLLDQKPTG